METGAITGYIDVAQLVLYGFWVFFAGLIIYLRREDKREGYPLESDRSGAISVVGFPKPPQPKTFLLRDGRSVTVPKVEAHRQINAEPLGSWLGAPLLPQGDPLLAALGPGAYPEREEVPDLTLEGEAKIVPLRVATGFSIAGQDTDPRGLKVVGADREEAGVVSDIWVDRSDPLLRYFEIELSAADASVNPAAQPDRVLVPYNFAHIDGGRGLLKINAVLGAQIRLAPRLANPDQITLQEEDKVSAFYAGGLLFATPDRSEPLF
jgi:photosynthetic reaction center H subunit